MFYVKFILVFLTNTNLIRVNLPRPLLAAPVVRSRDLLGGFGDEPCLASHGRARPCGDTPSERRLRMPIATSSVEALRRPLESTGECLRRLSQHRGVARRGVVHRPFRFASAFGPRQVVPPPVSAPGRSVEPISPRGGALRRVGPTFAECPRACAAEIAGRGITASITNGDGEAAINDKTKPGARR